MRLSYLLKVAFYLLMLLGMDSCAKSSETDSATEPNCNEEGFTVANARELYESIVCVCLENYAKTDYANSPFYPGDYTPKWDNAVKTQCADHTLIYVPILSSRSITAVCASYSENKSSASTSAINQSLVIEKYTNNMVRIYMRSLIADNTCNKTYRIESHIKVIDPFVKSFSGVVCNYSLSGKLMYVERIYQGAVTNRAKAGSKAIRAIFSNAGVGRLINVARVAQTRFGGEDDWVGADGLTNEEWIHASTPGDWDDIFDDDYDGFVDDGDFEYDLGLGWAATCPFCKKYTWYWDIDDTLPSYAKCPKCGKIVRFSGV